MSQVATCVIKASGTEVSEKVQSVRIEQALNRIAYATISLADGDQGSGNFAISTGADFVPGNEVTIELGWDGSNSQIFAGIVTSQTIRIGEHGVPLLEVVCKDKAVKMTIGRKSCAWSKKTDSDVMTTLIGNASGTTADVASTKPQLPELVQYYASDWDFLVTRAEVNGLLVKTINNTISVFDPTSDTSSALTVTMGEDLINLEVELDAVAQLAEVKASAWDAKSQALINASASNSLAGPGNLSSKTLSDVIGLASFPLQSPAAETNDELTAWAKAQMLKNSLAKITGTVTIFGNSTVLPGKWLTLAKLSARLNGDHFVSSVRHDFSQGTWQTEIGLGMSPAWFSEQQQITAPAAGGMLPGIEGLFTGTVLKIDSDPDDAYRIQVEVALFNDDNTGLWARMANFYSTNGQGAFFLPEVGDEVILGFLNHNPRFPVILGSLYSQKNKPNPKMTPDAKNPLKGFFSKTGLQLLFDDDKKIMTLATPGGNTLILDDDQKQVTLQDQNGNSLIMGSSGITLKSGKTLTVKSDKDISISGQSGVALEASGGDTTLKGTNISATANAEFTAKGNAQATVQGGGQLTLKGAMVMIN